MFVVKKRFGRAESRLSEFAKEQDAINFIMEKLKEDARFKSMAVYCLYEGADLLREYSQSDIPQEASESDADAGSGAQQKGSGQSFRPTPFNTTPRLGPQTWIKEDKKDEDEDDKK